MDGSSELPLRMSYRAALTGDGSPGPIEERLGRRLLRLVDAESAEGTCLLDAGRVDLTGPDGERLGRVRPESVYRSLLQRLEGRLARERPGPDRSGLAEGIDRLKKKIVGAQGSWMSQSSPPRLPAPSLTRTRNDRASR